MIDTVEPGTLLRSRTTGTIIRTTGPVTAWSPAIREGHYVYGVYVELHGRDAVDAPPVDVLNAQVRDFHHRDTRFDFADFEPVTTGVTGRTAQQGQMCSQQGCRDDAVSTFLIDDRTFGHACERHIIKIHGLAEATTRADVYKRGTRTGRVNMTHVPTGARILAFRRTDTSLMLADTKTDALIATVLGKRKGGGFRCYILTTDLGDIVAPAAMAMHIITTTS